VLFLDLRDSTGVLQAVSAPEDGETHMRAERLRQEWVVRVSGELRLRKDPNPRMPTGASDACSLTLASNPVLRTSLRSPAPLVSSAFLVRLYHTAVIISARA
jgi:aspartyl-tRNA synthetase